MNTNRFMTALVATLLGVSAQGVEIGAPTLELTPTTVMPGTPFVASLGGEFSQSCLLGPGVVTGSYSNDGFEIKFRTHEPGTDCVATALEGTEHFGAFRLPENATNFLNPDIPMKVTFIVDGDTIAESELDLTFDPAEMPGYALSPGIYWDSAYRGSGISIEDLGDYLFIAGFMFDAAGDAVWRTAQGEMLGGTLDTNFLSFDGGSCLACGDTGVEPALTFTEEPVQFMVKGTGEVFLAFGDSPTRAVHLNRFDTQAMPAEERAPVLFGEWTFVDVQTGMVHEDVRFDTALRAGDVTLTTSEDTFVAIECRDYGDCRVAVDGVFEDLMRAEVTPDRILGARFIGIRIR